MIDVHSTLGQQLLDVAVGRPYRRYHRTATEITSRGNLKPANAEADEDVMTPVSCPARWLNATVPTGLIAAR